MAALLQSWAGGIKPGPVGVRVQVQYWQALRIAAHQAEVVLQPGVHRPNTRFRIVLLIVGV